jgi:hypothetical protein
MLSPYLLLFIHPKLFHLLLILLGLGISYCLLSIINITINFKYETEASQCISTVTGRDLCFDLNCYLFGAPVLFALLVMLSVCEEKIVKPRR